MSKKEPKPKTIEAEVEVVSSKKSNKPKPSKPSTQDQQAENPFAGMGGMGGAAGMNGMPDLSAMFGKNGIPDLSKIPGLSLRQRLTFKLVGLLSNPRLRFLKTKWSIPIWGLIAVFVLVIVLCAAFLFLIFKLLRAILTPYINIFRKKG
jgi:hypothetical protein